MNRLEGKVVIITGASGGLGKQMALRFAQEGAKLAICARREKKLQETKDLCQQAGAQVLAMVADVSHHDELKAFVEKTAETFGTIDVLVNNASTISAPHPFLEHTINDLEEALHSGLYGTWQMMQLCFPYMKEHGGSIINFGSIGGVNGLEGFAAREGGHPRPVPGGRPGVGAVWHPGQLRLPQRDHRPLRRGHSPVPQGNPRIPHREHVPERHAPAGESL